MSKYFHDRIIKKKDLHKVDYYYTSTTSIYFDLIHLRLIYRNLENFENIL